MICRKSTTRIFAVSACLLTFAHRASIADAASLGTRGPLILLVRDLSLNKLDLSHLPSENVAIAAMNCVPGKGPWEQAAAIAMATGVRAVAGQYDLDILPIDSPTDERDPAGVVFKRRTGTEPVVGTDVIVHLGIAPLMKRGLSQRLIGALDGNRIMALGREQLGAAGLMAVGSDGIGKGLLVSQHLAQAVADKSGALVVDLDAGKERRDPAHAMKETDEFLGELEQLGALKDRTFLIVSYRSQPGELGVAILAGPGVKKGVLTSSTTRTKGVVALADVAPTILMLQGRETQVGMDGHPMHSVSDHGMLDDPRKRNLLISENARAFKPFVLWMVALGVVGVMLCIFGATGRSLIGVVGMSALVSVSLLPLSTLLFGGFALLLQTIQELEGDGPPIGWVVPVFGMLCIIHVILFFVAWPFTCERAWFRPVKGVSMFLIAGILLDAFTGQNLMKLSLLGEGAGQGIRYYGIGNEYMGVLLAAALVWAVSIQRERHHSLGWPSAVILTAVLVCLGLPQVGADAGGLVAALVATGCLAYALRHGKCPWWVAAAWSVAGLGIAFAIAYIESRTASSGSSHIGSSLTASRTLGVQYLVDIAVRKAEMSLRILTNPLTLGVGAVIAAVFWAYQTHFKRLIENKPEFPRWKSILPASGWGAVAAILFNDSGAVSALIILGGAVVSGLFIANGRDESADEAVQMPASVVAT